MDLSLYEKFKRLEATQGRNCPAGRFEFQLPQCTLQFIWSFSSFELEHDVGSVKPIRVPGAMALDLIIELLIIE